MNNKYVKVVYQSEPIGPEKIILYLTTFDISKYNHDIEEKQFAVKVPYNKNDTFSMVEERLNNYVKNFYEPYIEEVKSYLKFLKDNEEIEAHWYDKKQ